MRSDFLPYIQDSAADDAVEGLSLHLPKIILLTALKMELHMTFRRKDSYITYLGCR